MQLLIALILVVLAGLPALLLPSTFRAVAEGVLSREQETWVLLGGIAAGVAVHLVFRRNAGYRFLSTFQHELSHLIAAVLVGATPMSFRSGAGAGAVEYDIKGPLSRARQFMVSIAPYWFSPLILLPALICALSVRPNDLVRVPVLALASLALVMTLSQISPRQPDLKRHGTLVPIVSALWLWSAMVVVTLTVFDRWSLGATSGVFSRSWRLLWHAVA